MTKSKRASGPALEALMETERIREESIGSAKQLGVEVPQRLPLLDAEVDLRTSDEAISRLLAIHAVAATAYGFDKAKAIGWLNQEALIDSRCETEKRFVFEAVGDPYRFKVQVEGMWALAWATGFASTLDFARDCDDRFAAVLPNLKQGQSSADFRRQAKPRTLEQVVAACDLAYCLHWGIREAELTGRRPPGHLKPWVVIERRRALEWLLGKEAWDEVPLDT